MCHVTRLQKLKISLHFFLYFSFSFLFQWQIAKIVNSIFKKYTKIRFSSNEIQNKKKKLRKVKYFPINGKLKDERPENWVVVLHEKLHLIGPI